MQYGFPLCSCIGTYVTVARLMHQRFVAGRANAMADTQRMMKMRQRTYRGVALLTSVCIVFAAAWLPVNVYNALITFGGIKYK